MDAPGEGPIKEEAGDFATIVLCRFGHIYSSRRSSERSGQSKVVDFIVIK